MKNDFKDKLNCKWKYDENYDYYETDCKNNFSFISGRTKENHFKHCPYCGRWIKEVKA